MEEGRVGRGGGERSKGGREEGHSPYSTTNEIFTKSQLSRAPLATPKKVSPACRSRVHGGPGVRPVPLEIHIQAFDISSLDARMKAMSRPAYSAILNHAAGGAPALLFVPTRTHARLTALDLITYASADGQQRQFLQVISTPCMGPE